MGMGRSITLTLAVLIGSLIGDPAAAAGHPETPTQPVFPAAAPVPAPPLERWAGNCGVPLPWVQAVWAYESHLYKGARTRLPGPSHALWRGPANPDPGDMQPETILLFGGVGRDGNADGRCDPGDPADRTFALLTRLSARRAGTPEEIRRVLWEWYGDGTLVERITAFSRLYAAHSEEELKASAFPLPLQSRYTYRNTWGDARGWGGRRIHVGTDLFAAYGTPVRSTVWGYVETKGWNPYGGWRVGIRDLNNRYHYFAHLSGFAKELKPGQLIRPGQVIGYVGNSGYGRRGTSGKFPPHLHYGLYIDAGSEEWPVNPYPFLVQWERAERRQHRTGQG